MLLRRPLLILIAAALFFNLSYLHGQTVYVNTPTGLFEIKDSSGICNFVPLDNPCGFSGLQYLNLALYKDTLYYTLFTGELLRFKLGTPGSCEFLGIVGAANAMTVDKNGILYLAGGNQLLKYDPYTKQLTNLGQMPFESSGDLIFYQDKLLLAGNFQNGSGSAIFEININNPSASTTFLNTGSYSFFGLLSFPSKCNSSKVFGLAAGNGFTNIIELDFENKMVLGQTCNVPLEIYDAASATENGFDDKVVITDLNIYAPCTPINTGSVEITTFYPSRDTVIYKLDDAITNTTGVFMDVLPGNHIITATAAAGGCSADTMFTIPPAIPLVDHIDIRDSHCNLDNGWIKIALNIDPSTVYSSINNGPFTQTYEYLNLSPGNYFLQVRNGPNCYHDTTILIRNINDEKPQISIMTTDQVCFVDNGSITLNVTGNDEPYSYSLNGGNFITDNNFSNLAPGNYQIAIKDSFDCQWDTVAVVAPYPFLPVTTNLDFINPTCRGIVDGSIKVEINGTQNPYYIFLNDHRYNNGQTITGLTEGSYFIQIKNTDQCVVDSATQVLKIDYEPGCNDVFIPSAFTPNHDGRNDLFRPSYSYFIKNITLRIFNRFGQKIYEGRGSSIAWDGTYKGTPQPSEVYVYLLTYTDYFGKAKILKGTVTLIN